MRIEVIGIEKFPEIKSGDKLSNIIIETCKKNSIQLKNNDIIVISQKIISKSENQIINILDIHFKTTTQNEGNDYSILLGPIENNKVNKLVSSFISKGYKKTEIIVE